MRADRCFMIEREKMTKDDVLNKMRDDVSKAVNSNSVGVWPKGIYGPAAEDIDWGVFYEKVRDLYIKDIKEWVKDLLNTPDANNPSTDTVTERYEWNWEEYIIESDITITRKRMKFTPVTDSLTTTTYQVRPISGKPEGIEQEYNVLDDKGDEVKDLVVRQRIIKHYECK